MPDQPLPEPLDALAAAADEAPARKRPKPGERRVQILQTLAAMLEQPGAERITTAALAARLDVSEAALYRHFASKAQMFEGLIEFIESSVFTLVNQIVERDHDPATQLRGLLTVLLQFGEKNPGMTRVMVGDALVFENERLQQRMNQFFDKIEATLRQVLRGLWRSRRPPEDLLRLLHGEPRIGRRHVALLVHVGTEGPATVGEVAEGIAVSLPAASRLARVAMGVGRESVEVVSVISPQPLPFQLSPHPIPQHDRSGVNR